MFIECHRTEILHSWSANDGRLLSGAVLVEFTLHDSTFESQRLRSRLVEYASVRVDPDHGDKRKVKKLVRHACEQVRRYFDGDGKRENVFADIPERPVDNLLPPAQEAELQAELRSIEREFATPDLHLVATRADHAERKIVTLV